MKVKPDVDRCALPFKGAVVIPQNNVQDCPVKQRLHLNLQGEKKKAGSNRTRFNTMQKKKILQMQNYRCDSSGARTSGLMNISNAFPKTDATLASNQAPPHHHHHQFQRAINLSVIALIFINIPY